MLSTEPHSPRGGKNGTANLPSSSSKNFPCADVTTILPGLSISHGGMHRRVKAVLDVLCRVPIGVEISLPLLILLFLMEENHTDIQTLIFACINVTLLLLWEACCSILISWHLWPTETVSFLLTNKKQINGNIIKIIFISFLPA